jgi:hypothetical protein
MASKNSLLGSGKDVVEEDSKEEMVKPLKLYRKDFPEGRVYDTLEEQEMMKRKGWTERPTAESGLVFLKAEEVRLQELIEKIKRDLENIQAKIEILDPTPEVEMFSGIKSTKKVKTSYSKNKG